MSESVLKWSEIATKLAVWVILAVVGLIAWIAQGEIDRVRLNTAILNDLQSRVQVIESNRYTSQDALSDHRMQAAQLAEFRAWIEANYPPKWLISRLDSIDQRLGRIEERSMP